MIRFTLHLSGGNITGFECRGHSGYAESGSDIICAAVSILASTCVNALETVAGVIPEAEAKDGLMRMSLPQNAGYDAQVILRAMEQGLRDVAESYPQYLQLTEKS